MTKSKTTRKALLSSALALMMCVAMLIATTFAWFTDTASTSVNKIQAGTLDVALYYNKSTGDTPEWVSAEGQTLGWKQATAANGTQIVTTNGLPLWEPDCTFSLPEMKIVNKGNLALKYKIIISGIQGDAKLNEAIEWTMDGVEVGREVSLAANAENKFTISGHMKEDAGNEYQKLSIAGIGITVVATQDTVEYDSTGNMYDKDAPTVEVSTETELRTALYNNPYAKIVLQNDITLSMQYDSDNDGNGNSLVDSAAGDTLSNYYEAGHYGGSDNRAARLVVKAGQYVILDLNGHTIARGQNATHGSWSRTDTDLIANFGILTVTNSSSGNVGMLKGSGFCNCGGAVLHNYGANAVLTVEKVSVYGNATGNYYSTQDDIQISSGQNTIINGDAGGNEQQAYPGGTVTIDGAKVYDEGNGISACLVKNVSGTMTIKGSASLSSPKKALSCDGGTVYVESATITGGNNSNGGYAIKAEAESPATEAVVVVSRSGVTITGEVKAGDGGTIANK